MNDVAKPKKEQKVPAPKKVGPQGTYKYLVCPGNNSRLLLSIFRARPWWQTTKEEPDFVWEMYRNPKRYAASDSTGKAQADWCALNHFERDSCLVTKHGLYWSLRSHFEHLGLPLPEWLPETYHVTPPEANADASSSSSSTHVEWSRWLAAFQREAEAVTTESQGGAAGFDTAPTWRGDDEEEGGPKMENPEKLPPIGRAHGAIPDCVASPPKVAEYRRKKKKTEVADAVTNVWIAKPAALSNRGSGIRVISTVGQVEALLASGKAPGKGRNRAGYIVQKYIERPLLVNGRKFDIRVFVLLVAHPRTGHVQSWFYKEGYLRTSSASYSLSAKSLKNAFVHLTNDGIQSQDTTANGYGKYEEGNKLSYAQFQAYLDALHFDGSKQGWVYGAMVDDMKGALKDMVNAGCPRSNSSGSTAAGLNPKKRRNCFELLGCDFMVDDQYQLKLIEANSNPCLEFSSAHLEDFLPQLLEDTFQLSVDVLFPPPKQPQTKAAQTALSALVEARKLNRFLPLYNEAAAAPLGSVPVPASSSSSSVARKSASSNSSESRHDSARSEGSRSRKGSKSKASNSSSTPRTTTETTTAPDVRRVKQNPDKVVKSHVTSTEAFTRSLAGSNSNSASAPRNNSSTDAPRRSSAPRFTTKSKQHEANANIVSQPKGSRGSKKSTTPPSSEMPALDLEEIDFNDI